MLRISSIIPESIVDGEGYRFVIFTQGCNHNCPGCHNPQTHDFNGGEEIETQEIIDMIQSNPLLDGITLSGGDPLFQAKELMDIVKYCKDNDLTVWIYTGFIFEEFIKFINNDKCDKRINQDMIDLIRLADVLVDGKFVSELKTLSCKFRGSSNQRLIDIQKSFLNKDIVEYEA